MTAKKRSYRVINHFSRDLAKVVELKVVDYVKQVDQTKLVLSNAPRSPNRWNEMYRKIESWISAQLSILSNQWEAASDQYRNAFASASKFPAAVVTRAVQADLISDVLDIAAAALGWIEGGLSKESAISVVGFAGSAAALSLYILNN
ncbi:uncharacterized protein JCM6883_001140 [Sporobolomyces salmoneus]|uniref:uncharacterized protein n=1 Tax=Sporobolomyces salmoneus TaxID=183962 RepID=UPI0031754388